MESAVFENSYSRAQKVVPPFTLNELTKSMNQMNHKTSTDPLGISNKILKMTKKSEVLKEHILNLFNKALLEHKVPMVWKHSNISMLLKNGLSVSDPGSYRPISSTPCLARLFERLVLARLQDFLSKNNVIITNQSGFRKTRQTRDNILNLVQTSQQGFNEEKKTLAVFFDIAGAFDKVWHKGLIYKLIVLKVPYYLVKIIEDFLKGRTFCVKIEGVYSEVKIIVCGVPQGGVLSPTMFSIYINDVPLAESSEEKTMLFADDIVYLLQYKYKQHNKIIINNHVKAERTAQVYLTKLETWMNRWRLSLAPHKCAQIVFSRAQKNENDDLNIYLYNTKIPYEPNPKFLGIIFDAKLVFSEHMETIKKKVKDRTNILKVLSYDKCWALNANYLVKVYKVLIRSVMDYACVITPYNQKVIDAFEVQQNNALRVIYKKNLMDKVSIETLRGWANIESIKTRHEHLMNSYYEKVIVSHNPMTMELFNSYKIFKRRRFLREELAVDSAGIVNMGHLDLIRNTNMNHLHKEKYPTILCNASWVIKEFVLDCYGMGPVGSGIR